MPGITDVTSIRNGNGSGFTTVDVSEDGTGKHTYDTVGVNSAGDEFRTAGGADGQGNESQSTVT